MPNQIGSVSSIFCLSPVGATRGLCPQQLGGAGMMGADSLAEEMKEARRPCLTKHLGTRLVCVICERMGCSLPGRWGKK